MEIINNYINTIAPIRFEDLKVGDEIIITGLSPIGKKLILYNIDDIIGNTYTINEIKNHCICQDKKICNEKGILISINQGLNKRSGVLCFYTFKMANGRGIK